MPFSVPSGIGAFPTGINLKLNALSAEPLVNVFLTLILADVSFSFLVLLNVGIVTVAPSLESS